MQTFQRANQVAIIYVWEHSICNVYWSDRFSHNSKDEIQLSKACDESLLQASPNYVKVKENECECLKRWENFDQS